MKNLVKLSTFVAIVVTMIAAQSCGFQSSTEPEVEPQKPPVVVNPYDSLMGKKIYGFTEITNHRIDTSDVVGYNETHLYRTRDSIPLGYEHYMQFDCDSIIFQSYTDSTHWSVTIYRTESKIFTVSSPFQDIYPLLSGNGGLYYFTNIKKMLRVWPLL